MNYDLECTMYNMVIRINSKFALSAAKEITLDEILDKLIPIIDWDKVGNEQLWETATKAKTDRIKGLAMSEYVERNSYKDLLNKINEGY